MLVIDSPFVDVEQLVGGLADHLLVLLGHAEQRADDHHRELHPEVLHEVEPAGADERVEEVGAQLADAWLEVATPAAASGRGLRIARWMSWIGGSSNSMLRICSSMAGLRMMLEDAAVRVLL